MKADRHDAPEWIKASSKRNRLDLVIPGLIGTVLTIGALHVAGQAFLQSNVQNLVDRKKEPRPVPVAEIRRADPETDWSKVVEAQARRDATSQPQTAPPAGTESTATKQTVFNDLNYTPRGADNVLSFKETYQPVEPEKPAGKVRVTVIKEEQKLKDFCGGAQGSIERRNCRSSVGLEYRN
ncbi:hypothetical protein A7D25_07615 [Pseudomonas sp. 21C1]|nr:hypothetical protein A7D25_07615 [Pseudomonas sp. 21C1]